MGALLVQPLALRQHVVNPCKVSVTVTLDAGQDVTGSSAAFVAPHAAGAGVRMERVARNATASAS